QALEKHSSPSLRDPSITVDDQIFLQPHGIFSLAEHREHHARITAHILDLLPYAHVTDHELVIFNANPDHCDLRTPITIKRRRMGMRSRRNKFTNGIWYIHRSFLSTLSTSESILFGQAR